VSCGDPLTGSPNIKTNKQTNKRTNQTEENFLMRTRRNPFRVNSKDDVVDLEEIDDGIDHEFVKFIDGIFEEMEKDDTEVGSVPTFDDEEYEVDEDFDKLPDFLDESEMEGLGDRGVGDELRVDPKPQEPKPQEPKPQEPKPQEPKPQEPKPQEPKPQEDVPVEAPNEPKAPKSPKKPKAPKSPKKPKAPKEEVKKTPAERKQQDPPQAQPYGSGGYMMPFMSPIMMQQNAPQAPSPIYQEITDASGEVTGAWASPGQLPPRGEENLWNLVNEIQDPGYPDGKLEYWEKSKPDKSEGLWDKFKSLFKSDKPVEGQPPTTVEQQNPEKGVFDQYSTLPDTTVEQLNQEQSEEVPIENQQPMPYENYQQEVLNSDGVLEGMWTTPGDFPPSGEEDKWRMLFEDPENNLQYWEIIPDSVNLPNPEEEGIDPYGHTDVSDVGQMPKERGTSAETPRSRSSV
jgi:hypothetical protein